MKQNYIKCLSLVLIFALLLTAFAPVYAIDASGVSEGVSLVISQEENMNLQIANTSRGFESNTITEFLYDSYDNPAYILSYSDDGYLIYDRNSGTCLESGELNPYRDYLEYKKYYGGILEYYVKESATATTYYSIHREANVSEIPQLTVDPNVADRTIVPKDTASTFSATDYEVYCNASDYFLRRRAFGYNDDNTCTAVATSLLLNYIGSEIDSTIVPPAAQFELLTAAATKSSDVKKLYPNAYALHRKLVNDCHLGAATFAGDVISGVWYYCQTLPEETTLSIEYLSVTQATIRSELDAGRPCMVTTTAFAGSYSWHTMVVYGYRLTSDGTYEYLVHTGWYSNVKKESDGYYRISKTWIPFTTGTNMLYRFTI